MWDVKNNVSKQINTTALNFHKCKYNRSEINFNSKNYTRIIRKTNEINTNN